MRMDAIEIMKDSLCHTCGIGFILPSLRCDHCNALQKSAESEIGAKVIDQIISSKLFDVSCPDSEGSSCVIIWSANAAEQLTEFIVRTISGSESA